MKAGFIGTGSMGLPLASNILDQEKSLVAYDINPEATASLADKQGRIVNSPIEVANESDIVFACMPSIESFRTIVAGDEGVIHGSQMKTFINLGTMGTEALSEMEATLAKKGVLVLDSPITGGVQRAWDKDITVITSGPQAVYDQAEPFLKSFARDIHYVGDKVGQAQITKICNNIMSFTNMIIGLEALTMASKAGVDPEKVINVINSGSGQNSATLSKIPKFVMTRDFNMEAPMHIIAKDAMLWRMESERLEVPQNVASATYQTLQQALAMGMRGSDFSEIIKLIERAADFQLPKSGD
jgi:2-hydroxy-3-oxopropionate reductase